MTKKALICGISGQDGAFLAKFLLEKGYEVHGTSRDAQMATFTKLSQLGIKNNVHLHSMAINDFRSVLQTVLEVQPDEIYNLAGQSSVGLSFDQPVETLESITSGTINLLEVIRFTNLPTKFYSAGSSECFGNTNETPATESTPFRPRSPYAVAKAAAFWGVANYRESYSLYACSGILFNHESFIRPARFVTRKIVTAACRIAQGSSEKLSLGNVAIARDWGWAPEYVEAMWSLLQQEHPEDFIIATGETNTLADFVLEAFRYVGLNWLDHVNSDPSMIRPSEIMVSRANPDKAAKKLGWCATYKMKDVVRLMVDQELKNSTVNKN